MKALMVLVVLALSVPGFPQLITSPYGMGVGAAGGIPVVTIGTQTWMAKNLSVTKFSDGASISEVTSSGDWSSTTSPARAKYDNDASYVSNGYGYIYNNYAIVSAKGICPSGFHVPSATEWTTLINYLGGFNTAGGAMKTPGTTFWANPNSVRTDSGFRAHGGGTRLSAGFFYAAGTLVYYATSGSTYFYMSNADTKINGGYTGYYGVSSNTEGFYVRCIKD